MPTKPLTTGTLGTPVGSQRLLELARQKGFPTPIVVNQYNVYQQNAVNMLPGSSAENIIVKLEQIQQLPSTLDETIREGLEYPELAGVLSDLVDILSEMQKAKNEPMGKTNPMAKLKQFTQFLKKIQDGAEPWLKLGKTASRYLPYLIAALQAYGKN